MSLRSKAKGLFGLAVLAMLCVLACERERPENPSGYGQPVSYDQYGNPIYGQPGQQGYPQPGYPQQYPPGQQQPPGYGQPGPQGTTSQPSALAIPCTSDLTCGTHRCNTQVGRCVYPCQNAEVDCASGLSCVLGSCGPSIGR